MDKLTNLWRGQRSAEISFVRALLVTASVTLICVGLSSWDQGLGPESYLATKADRAVRQLLGRAPSISPALKVFLFDDPTVDLIQSQDLELNDWALVLESLAAAHPAHIVIDKFFDLPRNPAQAESFSERVHALKVPVITAGFVSSAPINERKELALNQPWYQLANLDPEAASRDPEAFPASPSVSLYAYGPHPKIASALTHVGHDVDGGGWRAAPLIRLNAATVFPHIGFLIARDMHLAAGELIVNGTRVPIQHNLVQVSASDPKDFAKASFSMRDLVAAARDLAAAPHINRGDDVLILARTHHAGLVRARELPTAEAPAGYLVAGVMNSVLTGAWVHPFGWRTLLVILGALLGLFVAINYPGLRFWLTVLFAGLCLVGFGLASFSFLATQVAWFYPVLAFLLTTLTVFAERSRLSHLAKLRLDRELVTAGLVQRAFFPRQTTGDQPLEVVGHVQAADSCGGDWWWHFSPQPQVNYVLIGDVMGHGVPAALVTSLIYAGINTLHELWADLPLAARSPEHILRTLNHTLYSALVGEVIMTMFVARFDTEHGILTYANAGHKMPLFLPLAAGDPRIPPSKLTANSPRLKTLKASGIVLGMSEAAAFREETMPIKHGDRFIFYTDGAIENRHFRRQAWNQKAFNQRIQDLADEQPGRMLHELVASVQGHTQAKDEEDDFTVVVVAVA